MCTGGRAGVRYVITKFSRMDSLPNFLTLGAPLRARFARARSSAIKEEITKLGQQSQTAFKKDFFKLMNNYSVFLKKRFENRREG